jgi:hypothetical protein
MTFVSIVFWLTNSFEWSQRRGDARAATLIECVRRLEKERKTMLARIKAPSWEIPHHFHMTAVEHWMGNQQPQLFEVADLIKGHLRIATIARSSAQQPGKVNSLFIEYSAVLSQSC